MIWQDLTGRLRPGQDVMIFVHEKPDGDAWGSAFGLGLTLRDLGYRPRLIRPLHNISVTFSWLPGQELICRIPTEELAIPDDTAVVVLDCGDAERCEYPLDVSRVLLNVDHHISNPGFGAVKWLDTKAGATAQILCRLLIEAGVRLSAAAATCFYYALVTDTGAFRFSNTGVETLRVASELMGYGASLDSIREKLWENRPEKELVLLHSMLNGMIPLAGGRGVLCPLPYDLVVSAGIEAAETDTALEMIRSTQGIEAVMILKENEPGTVKLSLRTKEQLDGAAFMSRLGGGGHVRAAGATIQDSMDNVIARVSALLTEALTDRQG
ncbi:MAG: bifunctional oligoribonuclease/PAP phosphatase NrnA [Clostridiales bacterium]|nr:bifunctional oligoribonuclease/PAP phosphatase NrnA [Clostridiales bacterium]